MPRLMLVLLALSASFLAACGDEKGGEKQETAKKLPCEKADAAFVGALKSSLTIEGGGGLKRVRVVKVDPPPAGFGRGGIFAVAAQLTGPGVEGTTGIWVANGSPGNELIIGANSETREVSDFGGAANPDSPAADSATSVAESEVGQRAVECAEGG